MTRCLWAQKRRWCNYNGEGVEAWCKVAKADTKGGESDGDTNEGCEKKADSRSASVLVKRGTS